jgi:hypothetical protein
MNMRVRPAAERSLANLRPDLAAQWDETKNGELRPHDVFAKSGKKVWWQCRRPGHGSWRASPAHRACGTGCPVCGHRRVVDAVSFARLYPAAAKEWHPTKNAGLKPADVSAHSGRRIWWMCLHGHEWLASVDSRSQGRGCPSCSNYKTSTLEIRLYSELATIFHDVLWRHRVGGHECDVLLATHALAIEVDGAYWHRAKPKQDRAKTAALRKHGVRLIRLRETPLRCSGNDEVPFKRNDHHDAVMAAMRRLSGIVGLLTQKEREVVRRYLKADRFVADGTYRRICSYLPGPTPERSFAARCPHLVAEWSGKNSPLQPTMFAPKSNKHVWWRCRNGHEWEESIANRAAGNGCPYCSGHRVSLERCLSTRCPRLADQWHPTKNGTLTPENVTYGSDRVVWWRCPKGHEWRDPVSRRVVLPGCKFCSGRRASSTNNLATQCPGLSGQWHPTKNGKLAPEDVTRGSDRKVWWRCRRGHEWRATISSRAAGVGCPHCAGKIASKAHCLATADPPLSRQWHPTKNSPLTPHGVTPDSSRKVWWKCSRGDEWQEKVYNRRRGRGCPYCSGHRASPRYNLEVIHPKIASDWDPKRNGDTKPTDVVPGSEKWFWWRCRRGHLEEDRVDRRVKRNGCRTCRAVRA